MFLTHAQELRNAGNAREQRCACKRAFSAANDFVVSLQQLYSRIVGRFLGLRRRIGRRFRNRRHFQSKQWIAHALGSVAPVDACSPARQRTANTKRGRTGAVWGHCNHGTMTHFPHCLCLIHMPLLRLIPIYLYLFVLYLDFYSFRYFMIFQSFFFCSFYLWI